MQSLFLGFSFSRQKNFERISRSHTSRIFFRHLTSLGFYLYTFRKTIQFFFYWQHTHWYIKYLIKSMSHYRLSNHSIFYQPYKIKTKIMQANSTQSVRRAKREKTEKKNATNWNHSSKNKRNKSKPLETFQF